MIRLKVWQWVVLALPVVSVLGFLGAAAGLQIHQWGLSWIWAIVILVFLGWQYLLVRWLRLPDQIAAEARAFIQDQAEETSSSEPRRQQAEAEIQTILVAAREDVLPWEDWTQFFRRCQTLIEAIAHVYYPTTKRPFLNIYVPDAYGLLRGTVDDVDQWMQKLSPVLGQVTVGQAYETYETYRKLEPAARTAVKVWQWSRWIFNPVAALTRTSTQTYRNQANQQLLANLGQIVRETTLQALGERAIALYSGEAVRTLESLELKLPEAETQTLQEIITEAAPAETVEQAPLNVLLVGRTGAGKSSLVNTLFGRETAAVDVLPSTDTLQSYRFENKLDETLTLWDSPGYEQSGREDLRQAVLEKAAEVDLLLLVTPATDPALQMDLAFLEEITTQVDDLPVISIVTQVDRLRPIREWSPPYDWRSGDQPKETSIREAIAYRQEILGEVSTAILPMVTGDTTQDRQAWGGTELSAAMVDEFDPAKQARMARFLRDRTTRITTAAKIINQYASQMSTTQGLAALLKSPLLGFLSTMTTGSPALATALATQLPIEQAPVVMGKLQMGYELFTLLAEPDAHPVFDFLSLWPLLLETAPSIQEDAWAFGQTMVELWTGKVGVDQLQERYQSYLSKATLA
ncbi:GTPase family protein [Acaryochloris sp. CCMEE 5410]|uniref:GTPase family protein n=1 Tax=Acaryochloris sp. CCMEE 5410 TaxID=310037 RepID=UPI000248494F|nr:GTPase [Acaryochloris sp. CCMEE 5410]KAI9131646.1 50S ribosome-binding GTPase [Acaryochloris sp. CCMEE 5410]